MSLKDDKKISKEYGAYDYGAGQVGGFVAHQVITSSAIAELA